MTSNAEREFPPPFLRRCIRLTIQPPDSNERLSEIVNSHLSEYLSAKSAAVNTLIGTFLDEAKSKELATDQLLNAVFLTIGMDNGVDRKFDPKEIGELRALILEKIG
jgi:MoxR-like ATPase